MIWRTRHCECSISPSLGAKRDTHCPCGNPYVSERVLAREGAGRYPFLRGRCGTCGDKEGVVCDLCGNGLGTTQKPRRKAPLKRGRGFSASPEQQRATKGRACIVCGKDEAEANVDPAHVTPRRMAPHCECEKGTVPLCRSCHKRYDDLNDPFDLLPYLMAHDLREETVHGFLEHGVSLREVMDVVTGQKWVPRAELENAA